MKTPIREKFTDKELLSIFPEAKKVIPEKIAEWEALKEEFSYTIKKKLEIIRNKVSDEISRWFWREWVKLTDGEELLRVEAQIGRLRRLQLATRGKTPMGQITPEQIQQALTIPLETIVNQPFRKIGNRLMGLCPFHKEKHPSFYIYLESNRYHCFGCQESGDTINFVRRVHSYSFREAVNHLTKQ